MIDVQAPSLASKLWRFRHFYLFISPFFVLFSVFGLYPLIFSLVLSFVHWDGFTSMQWVGLGNFKTMFQDEILGESLENTLIIGIFYVPPMLILAFLFAQLVNSQWLKFKSFFRAALFVPCVTPMVVISTVFGLIFSPEKGVLNYALLHLGRLLPFLHIQPVDWLGSEQTSKVAIAILLVWRWTGYNMVLMLAGLQGIPSQYYEAAEIDGANGFQRMIHITAPMMQSTFRFCLLLSLLGTLYMFDEVFVLTQGGPGISSTTFGLYLFDLSFQDFKFGYASCVAYSVAAFVVVASVILNKVNNRVRVSA